jgi:hypothetical protein
MILTTAVDSTSAAPSFGVFDQLGNYGPLGLAVLALGYVAWMLIQRHLAEIDRKKLKETKTTRKKR